MYLRQVAADAQEVRDHESAWHAHAYAIEIQLREAVGAQLLERDAAEALEAGLLEHHGSQLLRSIAGDVVVADIH